MTGSPLLAFGLILLIVSVVAIPICILGGIWASAHHDQRDEDEY